MRKANCSAGSPPNPRRSRRRESDFGEQRGQALAEFAIVVPLLLLLLVGIVEFGSAWRSYQVVTNTAREGARMTVVANQSSYSAVMAEIERRLEGGGLDPEAADVVIDCGGVVGEACFEGSEYGGSTEVRIEYPHRFVLLGPMIGLAGAGDPPGSVTIATRIVMRNE